MLLYNFDTLPHTYGAQGNAYTALDSGTGVSSVHLNSIASEPTESQFRTDESLPLIMRGTLSSRVKSSPVANGLLRNNVIIKIPTVFTDATTGQPTTKWSNQVKVEFTTSNHATEAEVRRIFAALLSLVCNSEYMVSVMDGIPLRSNA